MYLCIMNKSLLNVSVEEMAEAVRAYVRARAIRFGTFIIYEDENKKIVQEDPRTGEKTVIS